MSTIPPGQYNLKFNIAPVNGTSAAGRDYLRGSMVVVGGEYEGAQCDYLGMFDENDRDEMEKTARALILAGWDGDVSDFNSVVGNVVPGVVGISKASGNFPERNRVTKIGKAEGTPLSAEKKAAKSAALAHLLPKKKEDDFLI